MAMVMLCGRCAMKPQCCAEGLNVMAAEKRRAFALKRSEEAIECFAQGEWRTGLAKAQAARVLLEGSKGLQPEDTSILCGGVCFALAACDRIGEALAFFAQHAVEIADESVKEQLLAFWVNDANSVMPGDLVQFSGVSGSQLVGEVVGPAFSHSASGSQWRVQMRGTAEEASAVAGPGEMQVNPLVPEAKEEAGQEMNVNEAGMTLLTLRLSQEQRRHWRNLREEKPELFGERIRSDNEVRWQRLFGAAARRQPSGAGVGASHSFEDSGLPLEQSFVATLYGLVSDYLEQDESCVECLVVDMLGCRPALELDEPEKVLTGLLEALPPRLLRLTVRMCGPEVGCEAYKRSWEVRNGRQMKLEVRPGLYHDVFPEVDAHLVVAMNAGVGVPQYAAMWGPTLDLLARRAQRSLFAVTSYTAGELIREERMLRFRWAETFTLADVPELAQALTGLNEKAPWTLSDAIRFRGPSGEELLLRRGDVVVPWPACVNRTVSASWLPVSVRILCSGDLAYVGPNLTPGRSRNYGKLLLWVGGGGKHQSQCLRRQEVAAALAA